MTLVWAIAFAVLVIAETVTMQFVFLSIALGCLLGAIAALIGAPELTQAITVGAGSVAGLAVLTPILRHRFTPKDTATAVDAIVGSEAEVIEAIRPPSEGKVKLDGVVWQASSTHEIPAGTRVIVTDLKGTRLTVLARGEIMGKRFTGELQESGEAPRQAPQQDLTS